VLPFNLDPDDFIIKAELPDGVPAGSVQPILDPRDLPYLVKELTGMRVIAIEQLIKDDQLVIFSGK
jgi:hypothetical protein